LITLKRPFEKYERDEITHDRAILREDIPKIKHDSNRLDCLIEM
jgi:hypothetical protein